MDGGALGRVNHKMYRFSAQSIAAVSNNSFKLFLSIGGESYGRA